MRAARTRREAPDGEGAMKEPIINTADGLPESAMPR